MPVYPHPLRGLEPVIQNVLLNVKDMLIKKIKEGGRGNWGVLPMPPNAGKLSDDEFKEVVQWITSL